MKYLCKNEMVKYLKLITWLLMCIEKGCTLMIKDGTVDKLFWIFLHNF